LTSFILDSITFASILPICATFVTLKWSIYIHGKYGFVSLAIMIIFLKYMYSKYGTIKKADILFDKMCNKHIISWNTIIIGNERNGCSKESIKLFKQMEYVDINLDDIFFNVLFSCSHGGLVQEGYQYFKSMNDYYHITPTMKYYTYMVYSLSHVGCLDESKEFINNISIKNNTLVWTCFLSAYIIHKT